MNHRIKGFLSLHMAAGRIREDRKKGQKVSVCRYRGGGGGEEEEDVQTTEAFTFYWCRNKCEDIRQTAAVGTHFTL